MVLVLLLVTIAASVALGIIIGKQPTKELNGKDFIIWICSLIIIACAVVLITYLENKGVLLI